MEAPSQNPYEAPVSHTVPTLGPHAVPLTFRNTKLFAWIAALCIAVTIPHKLLSLLLSYEFIHFPNDVITAIDGVIGLIFLIGIIFYCIWKFRSAHNTMYFYGGPLQYSPGWCVGAYFVLILMLFRPYQCMKEIFEKTEQIRGVKIPTFVMLFWWFSWIFAGVFGNFASTIGFLSIVFCHAFLMLSAIPLIFLIYRLTSSQYEIIADSDLRAKIGTFNPWRPSGMAASLGTPMTRPQIAKTTVDAPTSTNDSV